jgi:serine/threonine protein kinase
MGTVHLVREDATSRLFALKRLHPRLFPNRRAPIRFAREIEILKAATQPDRAGCSWKIVNIHEAGAEQSGPWYAMEYCERGNVEGLLAAGAGPLSPGDAVNVAIQILDALDYLHHLPLPASHPRVDDAHPACGIVHRDVKPKNVLLAGDSGLAVKLADFGLAKAFELSGVSGVTSSRATGGDLGFAARCQAINFRDCGPEVDVWQTAATLFFLLTGELARDFSGPTAADVIVLERPARQIRSVNQQVPEELAEVVDHALKEDDESPLGFRSALEFRDALRDAARRCGLDVAGA